jgi:large subunit ribosomal protein L6
MALGFSHPVEFPIPEGITAAVDDKRTKITLSGAREAGLKF